MLMAENGKCGMLVFRRRYAGMASRQCLAWVLASGAGRMDCSYDALGPHQLF